MDIVKIIEHTDEKEFLNAITYDFPRSSAPGHDFLMFRGVSNGDGPNEHKLIPSSLRLENFEKLKRLAEYKSSDPAHIDSEWIVGRCECRIIAAFFRFADLHGLPIPDVDPHIRREMWSQLASDQPFLNEMRAAYHKETGEPFDDGITREGIWPIDTLLPLIGLAQHYNLPTRLLDWSRDALTAAYFAATGAVRRIEEEKEDPALPENKLAVWVFNAELMDKIQRTRLPHTKERPNIPLTIVTTSAASNPNLRAQQGVFTAWRLKYETVGDPVDRRPLNEIVEACVIRDKIVLESPPFYKITLPLSRAHKLLHLLLHAGVNAAKLFHGYEGAAKAVREWSDPK